MVDIIKVILYWIDGDIFVVKWEVFVWDSFYKGV